MNDQRRPMPCLIAISTSAAEATPSATMRSAAPSSAACMRLATKPATSRRSRIGAWPTRVISVVGALDHRGIGPGRRAQLDQRRHVRRVDRMGDQAALAPGDVLGEAGRRDARGRAREDRIRRGQAVELAEHLALDLDPLGRALLHVGGAVQRLGEPDDVADAAGDGVRVARPGRGRRDPAGARRCASRACFRARGLGVVQHDVVAGARRTRSPRPGRSGRRRPARSCPWRLPRAARLRAHHSRSRAACDRQPAIGRGRRGVAAAMARARPPW